MTLPTIVIDADPVRGVVNLVPEDGPFALAMRALAARAESRSVPDRVFLELYGYEIVERIRERLQVADCATWRIPFWPDAAMTAAGIEAHAARELTAMWPDPLRVVRRAASTQSVDTRQLQVFGSRCFDAAAYARAVMDDDFGDGQRVVGMLLRRHGSLLLERRSAASPYAGLWDTPGGKIEPRETVLDALEREAGEELGIPIDVARLIAIAREPDPTSGRPFVHFVFDVEAWLGEPQAREGQQLAWQAVSALADDRQVNPLLAFVLP